MVREDQGPHSCKERGGKDRRAEGSGKKKKLFRQLLKIKELSVAFLFKSKQPKIISFLTKSSLKNQAAGIDKQAGSLHR